MSWTREYDWGSFFFYFVPSLFVKVPFSNFFSQWLKKCRFRSLSFYHAFFIHISIHISFVFLHCIQFLSLLFVFYPFNSFSIHLIRFLSISFVFYPFHLFSIHFIRFLSISFVFYPYHSFSIQSYLFSIHFIRFLSISLVFYPFYSFSRSTIIQ